MDSLNALQMDNLLLNNIKSHAPKLRELLAQVNDHWGYVDGIYRFYHQSFKVYSLQHFTTHMVKALRDIAPENRPFTRFFDEIIRRGTGRQFKSEDNQHWVESTTPIVEAFFHARYFVEMSVRYCELPEAPQMMPSGWAALLSLFDLH